MAGTWKELHDDFLQEILLYTEQVTLTPPQIMRYLTKGMSEFQRRTAIAEDVKTLTMNGADTVTDIDARFPVGTDILEIIEVRDTNEKQMLIVGYQQFRDIKQRADSGERGYHETPAHFSRIRERDSADVNDVIWENTYSRGMTRICTVYATDLLRYPPLAADTSFEMRYRPDYPQFSSFETYWAAWFPLDTAFDAQFVATGPPDQIRKWSSSFVAYGVAQFLRSQNVLSGEQPLWLQYMEEFNNIVNSAIESKQHLQHELVAPYNLSPYSS